MTSVKQEYILAYDSDCGPCSGFKSAVKFLDARRRIAFVPLLAADESGMLDGMTPSARFGSFHLIRRKSGARSLDDARSGSLAILPLATALLPRGHALVRAIETSARVTRALGFAYSTLSRLHGTCSPRRSSRGSTSSS